jgi:hypothetical protein
MVIYVIHKSIYTYTYIDNIMSIYVCIHIYIYIYYEDSIYILLLNAEVVEVALVVGGGRGDRAVAVLLRHLGHHVSMRIVHHR